MRLMMVLVTRQMLLVIARLMMYLRVILIARLFVVILSLMMLVGKSRLYSLLVESFILDTLLKKCLVLKYVKQPMILQLIIRHYLLY